MTLLVSPPSHIKGQCATYTTGHRLGSGTYGIVHQATRSVDGFQVAVKIAREGGALGTGARVLASLTHELDALRQLSHKNIVHYIDHATENGRLCIVVELAPHGDLATLLGNSIGMTEEEAGIISCQCLSALVYIHANSYIHRDLKPGNILVHSISPIVCKISDFGCAKFLDQVQSTGTFCGTGTYMAPEMRTRVPRYNLKVDVFAMGVIINELFFYSPKSPRIDIANNSVYPPFYAKALIEQMRSRAAMDRPTAQEALDSPWCQQYHSRAG